MFSTDRSPHSKRKPPATCHLPPVACAKRSRDRALGYLLCLFAVLVWGTTFVTTKQLLVALPPAQILLLRFVIGYAALWALSPKPLRWQGWRCEGRLALSGTLGISLYFFFENLALIHGSAGMVSVVVCISPLLTALLSRFLRLGTRLTRGYWLGFALAIAGVAITVTRGDLRQLDGAFLGAGLAALGALTWSAYTLIPQRVPHPAGGLAVTRRTFFWGLLAMLPLCAWEADAWRFAPLLDLGNAWRLLFLGLLASALCYAAWNFAVARLGGVRATLCLYLNPVVGVFAAALVLGEPLTPIVLLGVALTLTGVALSTLASKA